MSIEAWINTLIGTASAFGAAYAGSHFAFKFDRDEKTKEREKEQSEAANKILGAMIRQVNNLVNLRDQHIDPHRENPLRCIIIQAVLERKSDDLKIDFEKVSYLLDTIHRNHYFEMLTEADKFSEVINQLNHRSKYHLETIQTNLKKGGVKEGTDISVSQLKQAVGEIEFVTIQRATDQLVEVLDDAIGSIKASLEKSHTIFKSLFPTREFLRVTWDA